ncbi:hypothetical protein LTR67_001030 [Exophiala xenobiotica]
MPTTLAKLPVSLPTAVIPEFLDLDGIANYFVSALDLLCEDDFIQDAVWRDIFALTGTARTFYSAQSIAAAWKATSKTHRPTSFAIDGKPQVVRAGPTTWLEMGFTFRTQGIPATNDHGYLSVIPDGTGKWKIWILRTILERLESQPDVDHLEPVHNMPAPNGHFIANGDTVDIPVRHIDANGVTADGLAPSAMAINDPATNGTTTNSTDTIDATTNGRHTDGATAHDTSKNVDYECVVVGGGQAGLSAGGRLKALGVSYVIIEKHPNVGDSWKTRYDSMRLHTVREFAHLPFERTFPSTYQEWLTKYDLAEGYQRWAKKYGINIFLSTSLLSGSWIAEKNIWDLKIMRNGQESHITCSYMVFAVGGGAQFPISPNYEDRHVFQGVTVHSGHYRNSGEWSGKHGVIIGTGNTGHDVAGDMLEAGLTSVTMVQRSKTLLVPSEHYRVNHDRVYNEKIPTKVADRLFCTGPAAIGRLMSLKAIERWTKMEPERYDSLERVGFKLDREGDMVSYLFGRFGGYALDVGVSPKISQGLIKVKSDSVPVRYVEDGLVCANGDFIRADVVVFATGFISDLRIVAAELFGGELAGQLDSFGGLDEEGEQKAMFKPCGHPAFWYAGGAVGPARYMSRFVAMQIKAKILDTPLPIYTDTPPRNSSPKINGFHSV